jgi:hypothetical protein
VTTVSNGQAALDALYWRAEILQAMFWMRGEGLASETQPHRLAEFLAGDASQVEVQMHDLAAAGYLERTSADPPRYRLTTLGIAEGGRSFQDEFAELTHSAHYECAPGCWCHDPDHVGEPCPSTPAPVKKPAELPADEPEPDIPQKPSHAT